MRNVLLGVLALGVAGTASADGGFADARYADGNDYSARVFYSMGFGAGAAGVPQVGLRFDNALAAERGAPALVAVSFVNSALPLVSLQGVPVAGPRMVAGQSSDVDERFGFWDLSAGQIAGIAFTAVVFGAIVVEAADSGDETVSGTGGS